MSDQPQVVLYLFSTSNHNLSCRCPTSHKLSYISFLHQTTTRCCASSFPAQLSYISFLHQTTTFFFSFSPIFRCLISLFYIKPQRRLHDRFPHRSCLISLFYIKPQRILHILFIYRHLHLITHTRSGRNRLTTFYFSITISPSTLILKSTPSTKAWKSERDSIISDLYCSPTLYAPDLRSFFNVVASRAS